MTAADYLKQTIGDLAVQVAVLTEERDELRETNRLLLAEKEDLRLRLEQSESAEQLAPTTA